MRFLKIFSKDIDAPLTEAQQLAAYRSSGEAGLLGKLYEPYMDMVFALCYKYLKDEDACKDAVMQIFEKLLVDLKTHEVGHFKSWLHTVCRNFCLMKLRAAKAFVTAESIDDEGVNAVFVGYEAEDPLFGEGKFNALDICMGTLPEAQRRAIQLFYIEEKCYKEICEETGYEVGKVKSYIQNGKRNLKICIERNESK